MHNSIHCGGDFLLRSSFYVDIEILEQYIGCVADHVFDTVVYQLDYFLKFVLELGYEVR